MPEVVPVQPGYIIMSTSLMQRRRIAFHLRQALRDWTIVERDSEIDPGEADLTSCPQVGIVFFSANELTNITNVAQSWAAYRIASCSTNYDELRVLIADVTKPFEELQLFLAYLLSFQKLKYVLLGDKVEEHVRWLLFSIKVVDIPLQFEITETETLVSVLLVAFFLQFSMKYVFDEVD